MTFSREPLTAHNWPAVHALLEPAMARCGSTPEELIDELLSGSAQLWVLRKGGDPIAAAVSEIIQTPRGKIVHGRLLAGEGSVSAAVECVTRHARNIGAISVEIEGRPGWERRLLGWRRKAVIMELPLEGAN